MTPSEIIHDTHAPVNPGLRMRWMQLALLISLALHGAALVVVMYSGIFGSAERHSTHLTIQDIELSPLIATPAEPLITQPDRHRAAASATPPAPLKAAIPIQNPPPEIQLPAAESSDNTRLLQSTPLGLGMAHGYLTPLADGKTLREDVRAYYFELVEKINREWWEKAALLKEPLRTDGVIEISIQRNGAIEELYLVRGTGSSEADRLIAESIRKSSPLSPLPSSYEPDQFRVPLRIKAPLYMFRFKN